MNASSELWLDCLDRAVKIEAQRQAVQIVRMQVAGSGFAAHTPETAATVDTYLDTTKALYDAARASGNGPVVSA